MNSPAEAMSSSDTLTSDAELVAASLAGDQAAYGRIVARYQRLLCSLAFSATGSVAQSEDIAQETFIEGWRQLATLQAPEKLRSWLCGILRYKVSRFRRSAAREPVRQAGSLEDVAEVPSDDEAIPDQAVNRDEQELMWRALERVPEVYREPLVLYYRENRSVEHVAVALELTEDAVKQRLFRGRKILQEQVLDMVEGTLARTAPGKLFTAATLAALPTLFAPTSAQVAVAGTGGLAAKGVVMAKTTLWTTLIAAGNSVISAVLTMRVTLTQSRTPRERRAAVRTTVGIVGGILAGLTVLWLLRASAWRWPEKRLVFAVVAQLVVIGGIAVWPVIVLRLMAAMRRLRSAERLAQPQFFHAARDQAGATAGAYRSRLKLWGVPLIHIRFALPDEGQPPVLGWIAGGDRAYGLLCAWGAHAVAPISVGATAIGVVAIGNFSLGLFSFGTLALGGLAIGCASIGYNAYAWLSALGWHTAQSGGFGLARDAVNASVGFAAHVNDAAAHAILTNPGSEPRQVIVMSVLTVLSLLPLGFYFRAVRRRLG